MVEREKYSGEKKKWGRGRRLVIKALTQSDLTVTMVSFLWFPFS